MTTDPLLPLRGSLQMWRLLVRGAYVVESQVPVPLPDLPGAPAATWHRPPR
jgi:hypothetical protein